MLLIMGTTPYKAETALQQSGDAGHFGSAAERKEKKRLRLLTSL